MEKQSKVVLIRCTSYDPNEIREAIHKGLEFLGGVGRFAKPGEKILIKPNLLIGESPENCVNPHPNVFQALVEECISTGAELSYGDSPAVGSPQLAARQSGLLSIAEDLDVELADFTTPQTVSFPGGKLIRQFTLAKGVLEADGIISLCKMKTHALTRITGAIKNQFGCVPGVIKTEFHATLPDPTLFSKMLVDINLLLCPRLYVMDGVWAMDGNGPRNGSRRHMNVILFSTDPVALDTVFCRLVDLDEKLVDTIVYGEINDLGSTNFEILGDSMDSLKCPDFHVRRDRSAITDRQGTFFSKFTRRFISPRPVIDNDQCIQCGRCEEICPAKPKALTWKNGRNFAPVYTYDNCIRCYCCQETCPHRAITVKIPVLGRIIHR